MDIIEKGDRVILSRILDDGHTDLREGIVVHMPADVGDLLYIRIEGVLFALNTTNTRFVGLALVEKGK